MAPDPPPVLVEGLTKRLGAVVAVDGLDLRIERGQIVGMAGPNGAGKSITLKILLGLVRPTSGRVELFGEPARPGARVLGRVGALVDGPGFVPHLSGIDNLRLACRMMKATTVGADLDRSISIAGLGPAIDRKYHTYSHGMRYRLGLAQALLGRPELLLLDEPTTGLDPEHIREIRRDIIEAAKTDGATVLLSSHLLSEVEQVCTHAVIMQRGRRVTSGRVEDLVRRTDTVHVGVDSPERAASALRLVRGVRAAHVEDRSVLIEGTWLRPGELLLALDDASIVVRSLRLGRTLEEVYLDLVRDADKARPPGDVTSVDP